MRSQEHMKACIIEYITDHPGTTPIQCALAAIGEEPEYSIDIPAVLEQFVDDGILTEKSNTYYIVEKINA